jgi:hypothetical protein
MHNNLESLNLVALKVTRTAKIALQVDVHILWHFILVGLDLAPVILVRVRIVSDTPAVTRGNHE